MEERGLTEIDVRHLVEHATRFERSHHEGHWLLVAQRRRRKWIVVVRYDPELKSVFVVTAFEEES